MGLRGTSSQDIQVRGTERRSRREIVNSGGQGHGRLRSSAQLDLVVNYDHLEGIARLRAVQRVQAECRVNMHKENGNRGVVIAGYHYLLRVDGGLPLVSVVRF